MATTNNLADISVLLLGRAANEEYLDIFGRVEIQVSHSASGSHGVTKERVPCVTLARIAISKDTYDQLILHGVELNGSGKAIKRLHGENCAELFRFRKRIRFGSVTIFV